MRILMVEDNRLLNNTLCYNLSAVDHEVDSALTLLLTNFLTCSKQSKRCEKDYRMDGRKQMENGMERIKLTNFSNKLTNFSNFQKITLRNVLLMTLRNEVK